jgi:hypothetical protein
VRLGRSTAGCVVATWALLAEEIFASSDLDGCVCLDLTGFGLRLASRPTNRNSIDLL